MLRWLDERTIDPSKFEPLLQPRISYDLIATQIDKPSAYNVIAPSTRVDMD